ncbi:glycosyltransferase family 4 protein [Jeotgalicoccus sp. ATCC 8456]|uniref:glycosyltransferase family 4 protein n=1 Tax=Jeotgalicoccus sp. ATCC 8456 TaxID=946435 RepID=UPI0018E62888|nr:glycosyltransferase family 4 protein [Jeotgalicoccus sp. ATCC 8456]QQD85673.1 glycosyltransferase family 4 protein [Jeotgalicoccus sp. ATCC 8456]
MKILIAGHDLKFIQFYIDYLENTEHEVKLDVWENHVAHNVKDSYEYLEWADIIFCEWGLGNTIFYSQNKKENQKLIVRLHRQELETTYLTQAKIDQIDSFIAVSPYIYEEFSRVFQLPREKMHLIYNNVDLDKFKNLNLSGREYNLGMVGYLPKLKRMDLALDIFENLYEQDNRYHLHFKGKRPEELRWLMRIDEEREYYEAQFKRINKAKWKDNVIFESYGDVVEFYNQMEFILSISDVESFHLAAAEGIATGAIPIITNWEGSESIYSADFIIEDLTEVEGYITKMRAKKEEIDQRLSSEKSKFDQSNAIMELDEIIFA